MKRLFLAAFLAVVALEVAAQAVIVSVVNPVDHCTYSVWGPDITVYDCCPWGISKTGSAGESASCP